MDRRTFLGAAVSAAAATSLAIVGCSSSDATAENEGTASSTKGTNAAVDAGSAVSVQTPDLPPAESDPENEFGLDKNVNIQTVDQYLDIPGVVKSDLRLVQDPARYEAIGGNSELSMTIDGFRVVPMPYIGTLAPLPVSGGYEGDRLFDIEWGEGLEVLAVSPRYTQSMQMLEELFPKDAPIFLMCGGGGYAGMMRAMLVHLGWDPKKVYALGGMWDYAGERAVQLISYADPEAPEYYFWRTDVVYFDFSLLYPIEA